ncbi:hypothetical protein KR038_010539, partial [Drosophila bunnanda]
MDPSKLERQAQPEERNSVPPNYLKILLQDMICFFILLSLALLIVAGILYVADDVTRLQYSPRDPTNASRTMSLEERHRHRFLRPEAWFRLFSCQKQQEARLEQLHERGQRQEQEQELGEGAGVALGQPIQEKELHEHQPFGPRFVPTYRPNEHPENLQMRAGGDRV